MAIDSSAPASPHDAADPPSEGPARPVQVARSRRPAIAADGEEVSGTELEAAAELARLPRRLGLRRSLDGFRLYRVYSRYRDPRRRRAEARRRARP